MRQEYMEVNWRAAGYCGFPFSMEPGGYKSPEEAREWSEFEHVLAARKAADFANPERLLKIYDTANWLLASACTDLMGDTGSRRFFDALRPIVTGIPDPTYSVDLGRSLTIWGHLSVVPTLLEALTKLQDFDDASKLIHGISCMLEPEPGVLDDVDALHDIPAYAAQVEHVLNRLVSRIGSADAIVMFGELFSVEKLVDVMRERLPIRGMFKPYLRHKFEATTGVDCSGFYEDESLQPLRALAILEEFEDRDQIKLYRPGQRYFFGHPVPE